MAAVEIGQVLQDSYRITRLIGKGGMGVVYEAEHVRLTRRRFAIKLLHPSFAENAEAFARFRREAEIVSGLGHPHILYVLDFNELEGGYPSMVMELLEGEDLKRRLKRAGPLQNRELIQLLAQAGSALQQVHGQGVVHRDLKPSNIFLVSTASEELHIKLLDFGVSKVRHGGSVVTQDDALIGTPSYMSPEQARGAVGEIDPTTDIFSLAIITHYCLSGELPFEAPTVPGVLFCICYEDPKPLPMLSQLPPRAAEILARGMAKRKQDRYQQVEAFTGEMIAVLEEAGRALGEASQPRLPLTDEATSRFAKLPPAADLSTTRTAPTARSAVTVRPGVNRRDVVDQPVTTLSGAAIGLAPPPVHAPRRTPLLLGATAAVIALAGVTFYWALGPGESPEPVATATRSPPPSPQPRPRLAPPAPAAVDAGARPDLSDQVRITLRLSPPNAQVLVDGLPTSKNPLTLLRSTRERELQAIAPGHLPRIMLVVPREDQTLEIVLQPKVRPREPVRALPKARPEPLPRKKLYDDL